MLKIDGLIKQYRNSQKLALDGVSFSVRRGSFAALLGNNGAGKSTLIGILANTVKPNSGSVLIDGHSLEMNKTALRRALGIVPQEVTFDYLFTVEETLILQSGYFGLRHNGEWIHTLLHRLSLWDKRREMVSSLSGGMKRRLMIAKGLVHHPRLLLLDEPTAGVDITLRKQMHEFLQELNREGLTIVLTTHYLEEAEQLCDHIVLLHQGKVLADAPRAEFLEMAGDRFSARIVTERPERLRAALSFCNFVEGGERGAVLRVSAPKSLRSEFLAVLGKHAAEVKDIQFFEPHLEDVFIKLTATDEMEVPYEAVA